MSSPERSSVLGSVNPGSVLTQDQAYPPAPLEVFRSIDPSASPKHTTSVGVPLANISEGLVTIKVVSY